VHYLPFVEQLLSNYSGMWPDALGLPKLQNQRQ
jgi:hypothetical protein